MPYYRKPGSGKIGVATVTAMTVRKTTVQFLSLVRIHARSRNVPVTFNVPSFGEFGLVSPFPFEVVNRPLELSLLLWARDLAIWKVFLHHQSSKLVFNVGIGFEASVSELHQEASTQQFP